MASLLSQRWFATQEKLLPFLQEELGPLTDNHQRLVTTIEFARVGNFVQHHHSYFVGRPLEDRVALANAFIAKAIYNLTTTTALIDRLHCDPVMRRICGWEKRKDIPHYSTFSRAFAEFAEIDLASRIHEKFIKDHHSECIIGHVSRDGTAIEAREKAVVKPKKKKKDDKVKKQGRPKKGEEKPAPDPTRLERQLEMSIEQMLTDLPKECDIGCKKNSKGFTISWKGYKLHIDTIDGDIPVSAVLTSASTHDSQAALPLSKLTATRITNLYDLMDAAYDSIIIRENSTALGHVPLIDFNHRSPNDTREFAPHEKARYKERSSAERVNSNLKDNFGGRQIRVRGNQKVMLHLMFGLLALTIEQTIRLLT